MSDQATKRIMVGILICLIIIALKPVPSFQSNYPDFPSSLDVNNGEAVVQLSENRIAIVKSDINSGMHGEIFVLEFNEAKKSFDLIGRYNYADFFSNPQKYNP
ncbi:hypothetical protein P9E76_20195 [Schinkia azotoformans]|uniref:Uncharacterized protein n=1 Tax=Schinkia azotoformans LMG 9581 TaxID=1131731 RepID=K6D6M1_SCHAZ|nr:hypothetical protein [Schinkia azotoformans]EKN63703.1 hypothetical protein BAZO_16314 [Schinkia azotoformans LMG 9581]MEC1640884.1 hypothetical protein [Schinkia azotoformans]MEC1722120.1 hypothetical protein [Schinkia azotoformans]MEC1947330.1 hypothetical protein [Schinkia azotoformans]MED4354494.1 hypothetical protein [Schinkia azotoformans]